jgi:hypothetical protein
MDLKFYLVLYIGNISQKSFQSKQSNSIICNANRPSNGCTNCFMVQNLKNQWVNHKVNSGKPHTVKFPDKIQSLTRGLTFLNRKLCARYPWDVNIQNSDYALLILEPNIVTNSTIRF